MGCGCGKKPTNQTTKPTGTVYTVVNGQVVVRPASNVQGGN